MNVKRLLWGLWGALILSMLVRQTIDTYMVVALIIIPVLIVLLDLHDEIDHLKEENKHQRKFVLDRYNLLQERLNDAFSQIEKRMVVDFAEMSKTSTQSFSKSSSNGGYLPPERRKPRKLKKRQRTNYSQQNPFVEEQKSEDQRFAEERFGKNPDEEGYEDVPDFADEQAYDQDYYDEQAYDQPSDDYENDQELMEKEKSTD